MLYIGLVIATLLCAYQVMRAERLMTATIWLALASALVSLALYLVGAPEVAVIELSVGAGLVTVLFVFAFSIVGEVTLDAVTIVPRLLVWCVILAISFLMGSLTFPLLVGESTAVELPFTVILWEQRWPDVLAQIVLIFAGVIGVLGLLSDKPAGHKTLNLERIEPAGEEQPGSKTLSPNGHSLETEALLEEVHS